MIFHWTILDLLIKKQMCSCGTLSSLPTPVPITAALTFAEITVSVVLAVRDAIPNTPSTET